MPREMMFCSRNWWAKGLNFRKISPTIPTFGNVLSRVIWLNSSAACSRSLMSPLAEFWAIGPSISCMYLSRNSLAMPGLRSLTMQALYISLIASP